MTGLKSKNGSSIGLRLAVLALITVLAYAATVIGQPVGADALTVIGSERGSITGGSASTEAQAGNVTNIDINATQITTAWQGFYGNISGNIILANSAGNIFYNWTGLGSVSGEVYASRNATIDWAAINCTNESHTIIADENSFIGKAASDPDSIQNTFSLNSHPTLVIGATTIPSNTCNSTNAYASSGSDATSYYQILLAGSEGVNNTVYATIINDSLTGFDGETRDFELLVPENGNATEAGASTTYFFYIELS